MAIVQAEFYAVVKLTLVKSGKTGFTEEDVALAILEAEQEVNSMKFEPYNKANKNIRLHVGEPVIREEASNGDHQD